MSYEIIPQAPKYEMNEKGVLRNRKTKKIRKWSKKNSKSTTKRTNFTVNGKRVYVTLPYLLWLLHGKVTGRTTPIAVLIIKGTRSLRFDSLNSCAKFLAGVTALTYKSIRHRFTRRDTKIADWEIRYIDPKANPGTKGIV